MISSLFQCLYKMKTTDICMASSSTSNNKETSIIKFLNSECRVKTGEEYTHTAIANPCGSFYIDESNPDIVKKFYLYYKSTMKKGKHIYLTEKHNAISPILIDLDFKFDINNSNALHRDYTGINATITDICKLYAKEIYNYIDIDIFEMYVQRRPDPVVAKHNIKDGIHIIIPDVVTNPAVQYIIRTKVLESCTAIFDKIKDITNDYNDIIDKAVIEKNNWQMYGSTKPDFEPYKVFKIYKFTKTSRDIVMIDVNIKEDHTEYVELFSIRNKHIESKINSFKKKEVDEYIKFLEQRVIKENNLLQGSINHCQNICDDIETVKLLINILDVKRADKYEDWIRVAWCLRNIDHRLIDEWHNFSKKCDGKYDEYACNKIWNQIKKTGLTTGSLHYWAKNDNPVEYKRIMDTNVNNLIDKCVKPSEYDIARVVFAMYKNKYICSSIKNNTWWEYKEHRWQRTDCGVELRKALSSIVYDKFTMRIKDFASSALEYDSESDERSKLNKKIADMLSIIDKLKRSSFKDNIMKECRDFFYEKGFEEKLDSNINLIGFNNGVYDFSSLEFRQGKPDDYISLSTHINYDIYEDNDVRILQIKEFFEKIFINEAVRKNVITNIATSLHGSTKHQRFNLWTGSGCFAKDTKILMYDGSSKYIQDININDKIMGDDNTERNVLTLYRGRSIMYEIITKYGNFIINDSHELPLYSTIDNNLKIVSIKDYINDKNILENYKLRITNAIYFKHIQTYLEEDPYEYGLNIKNDSIITDLYMHTDINTRIKILTGIYDSYGLYLCDTNEIVLNLNNKYVVNLIRSLSMCCYEKDSKIYINKDRYIDFDIKELEEDMYYGFELDKNNLFVMADLYIINKNSNGKSVTIELCTKTFGDYYANLPVSLLTSKRPGSNCATPEIARLKGKRFVCLQESSDSDTLNVGYMKELTGGDKILTRALYSEPIEIILQTHMFYVCNILPKITNVDGGTARRIIVTDFKSKFCKNPKKNRKREFKYDLELNKKFEEWKEPFAYMLIEEFKNYLANGCIIDDPPAVLKATKEYTREHDTVLSFIEDELEKQNDVNDDEDDSDDEDVDIINKRRKNDSSIYKLTYNEILEKYRGWCRINNIEDQGFAKQKFIKLFENHIGPCAKIGKQVLWYRYRIKPKIGELNMDEEF